METINLKRTIDTHIKKKRKSTTNITVEIVIKSQKKRTKEEGKKKVQLQQI